ncbi:hypothetical protein ABFU82_26790 [Nocardioides sp. WV_118_6]
MTEPGGAVVVCPCGSTEFQQGFIDDARQGRVRWLSGLPETGLLGHLKTGGRVQRAVRAARCTQCSRLELYATDPL